MWIWAVSFFEEPVDQLFYKKKSFAVIPGGYQAFDVLGIVGIQRVDDNFLCCKVSMDRLRLYEKLGLPSWLLPWGSLKFVKAPKLGLPSWLLPWGPLFP
jgi:hypothetical protein